ncbi:MAG: hypothetical protein U0T11_09250 [Chitinophagaceae bacterium]
MNLKSIQQQSIWKMAVKVSALGVSLVCITYGFVWLFLNTLRLFIEGVMN